MAGSVYDFIAKGSFSVEEENLCCVFEKNVSREVRVWPHCKLGRAMSGKNVPLASSKTLQWHDSCKYFTLATFRDEEHLLFDYYRNEPDLYEHLLKFLPTKMSMFLENRFIMRRVNLMEHSNVEGSLVPFGQENQTFATRLMMKLVSMFDDEISK